MLWRFKMENQKKPFTPAEMYREWGKMGGRPPKYTKPEDMELRCEEYFITCIDRGENITITGLALYLGFSCRETIYEYGKKKGFSDVVKRAMCVVENRYEIAACNNNATGPIFILKNMGWSDRTEMDLKDDRRTLDNEEREARIKELKKKLGVKKD